MPQKGCLPAGATDKFGRAGVDSIAGIPWKVQEGGGTVRAISVPRRHVVKRKLREGMS